MSNPAILFCVGATKAGTSWLYSWLHDHPECHLRSIKELHFWDHVDGADDFWLKDLRASRERLFTQSAEARADAIRQSNVERRIDDTDALIAVLESADEGAYLHYMLAGAGEARLVADLTPAYSLLSEERLAHMASLPEARMLFILRDPVERLWSHVRMIATRRANDPSEIPDRANAILGRVCRGAETHISARGDYTAIVPKLRRAVPESRLCLTFFEDMLGEAELTRIARFLTITPRPANPAPVHEGTSLPMTDAQKELAREHLAPQYAFARSAFGTLPDAWTANLERV